MRHGYGTMWYEHGMIFEGKFRNDKVLWDEGTDFPNKEAYDKRFLPMELPERRRSTRQQINIDIEKHRQNQIKQEEEDTRRERIQMKEEMVSQINQATKRQNMNPQA